MNLFIRHKLINLLQRSERGMTAHERAFARSVGSFHSPFTLFHRVASVNRLFVVISEMETNKLRPIILIESFNLYLIFAFR